MEKKHKKIDENPCSEDDSAVKTEEKNLILLKDYAMKNVDETISEPERYVSRYHYSSKNIDKYLDFCPHCKKPTLSAFHRSVIDNAIEYLEGKRVLINDNMENRGILTFITFFLAIGTGIYWLLMI